MVNFFKQIVIVINDVDRINTLIQKGIEFSKENNSPLEVLFIHEKPSFKLSKIFSSSTQEIHQVNAEFIKKKIQYQINAINPKQKSNICILQSNIIDKTLEYMGESKEILFITHYHKELTPKFLSNTPYSYWILKNENKKYENICLPIALNEDADKMIAITKEIFSKSNISILHDYRYMFSGDISRQPIVSYLDKKNYELTKQKSQETFEEYKKRFDVNGYFIKEKKRLEEDLSQYIGAKDSDLVVMKRQKIGKETSCLVVISLLNQLSSDFLVFNL